MKFNKNLNPEICKCLEKEYQEYIKKTPMTKKEKQVLKDWVKDGNSVYENTSDAFSENGVPLEFLSVYREEEYLRQKTKGMNADEARNFALSFYGMNTEPPVEQQESIYSTLSTNLPF
ncbi:MAG: hypothetical protein ACOX1F_00255 [Erysipelotrichaceae bacterium]|jgi:hypothetical protein